MDKYFLYPSIKIYILHSKEQIQNLAVIAFWENIQYDSLYVRKTFDVFKSVIINIIIITLLSID